MTLGEIQTQLAVIDPDIRHYFSAGTGEAYTYWEETRRLPLTADDTHPDADQAWRFYVHRFTKAENDTIAANLFTALGANPGIAVMHRMAYENDTGYIHHIFECEGY